MIAKSAQRALLAFFIALQCSFILAQTVTPASNSTNNFAANSAANFTANTTNNSTKPANGTSSTVPSKASTSLSSAQAAKIRKQVEVDKNWAIVRAILYIWLALAGLFAISLLCLIFRRYIRTVSSLSPGNTQAYFAPVNQHWGWLKKHFVFAPLFHKRHHRPFMLTRTIDNGCLPSRPQTFILVTYFALLVFATFYDIIYDQPKGFMLTALQRRTGLLALANMPPLFILAARNNPLIWWTGVSFDTYNLFHRWLGRFVVLEIVAHTTIYLVKKVETQGWAGYKKSLAESKFIRSGTITSICAFIILFQTPAPFRHRFYETFLHLHQLLAAILVWGIWTHMDGYKYQRMLVTGIIAIWSIERGFRLIRLLYRNVGKPFTTAEVEIMSPIAMRVKIRLTRPWTFTPGQHAYMYMPFVGLWTAHPFSVAWNDEDVEETTVSEKESLPSSFDDFTSRKRNIYFLIRRMKGFTNYLYVKAEKAGGKLKTIALIEGPYNQQTLHSYGTVILVAAGIGITHIVPHVRDLVAGYGNGTVAARRVLLIWSVRTLEELELIRDWMTIILALPRRQEVLRIMLYVFQLDQSKADFPSTTIQVFPGIAKFGPIIDEEVKNSVGSIGVSVCGIGVVADEVRFACRKWMDKVNIEFMEESFSW